MIDNPNKSSKRDVAPRYSDPFSALRAEMDSLFDSFIGGLPAFSVTVGPIVRPGLVLGSYRNCYSLRPASTGAASGKKDDRPGLASCLQALFVYVIPPTALLRSGSPRKAKGRHRG